jgi:hypothetical protein
MEWLSLKKGYAVLGGYFFGTCFRTEITSKGKRRLSRQKVARRSFKQLQKLDQVALVGNQHSKWKVSGRHVNRNIYVITFLKPVKNQRVVE